MVYFGKIRANIRSFECGIYDFSDNVDKFLFNIDCLFLFID